MADFEKHRYIIQYREGYYGYSRETHNYAIMRSPEDAVLFDDIHTAFETVNKLGEGTVRKITCAYTIGDVCDYGECDPPDEREVITFYMLNGEFYG